MTAKRKPDAELTDHEREIWAKFDAEIQKGIDSINAGEAVEAEPFFNELIAKYQAMGRSTG
ncbi:MAG: hypothetical protein ABIR87_00675 [Sphingomicrobium sp.]